MDLCVGDLGVRERDVRVDELMDPDRAGLRADRFEQGPRVGVGRRRSSMTVWAMVGPLILTVRMRFSGFRVGSVRRPWAASIARRASRLVARFADLIGMSKAMGLPRSVTTISSPFFVLRRQPVIKLLSSSAH